MFSTVTFPSYHGTSKCNDECNMDVLPAFMNVQLRIILSNVYLTKLTSPTPMSNLRHFLYVVDFQFVHSQSEVALLSGLQTGKYQKWYPSLIKLRQNEDCRIMDAICHDPLNSKCGDENNPGKSNDRIQCSWWQIWLNRATQQHIEVIVLFEDLEFRIRVLVYTPRLRLEEKEPGSFMFNHHNTFHKHTFNVHFNLATVECVGYKLHN